MALSFIHWLGENKSTYFGNATAVRDYRAQLRSARSVWLFALYLGFLIFFAMLVYYQVGDAPEMSIVVAQEKLKNFYMSVIAMLGAAIIMIAPALTATAVIQEKQRGSLDLIFSAPVKAKYYLVGKMISSFRFTWMILALSLPVTAACVVLGGATWADVLATYILLSLHALCYTALSLLVSAFANKPVAAIIYSYTAIGAYSTLTGMMSLFGAAMMFSGSGGPSQEQPFFLALNPFSAIVAASTYTTMWGIQVPNWVLVGVFTALFSKICVLAAGSILSPFGSPESKSLRLHGLVYVALFTALLTWASSPIAGSLFRAGAGVGTMTGTVDWSAIGILAAWCSVAMLIFAPFLCCYGYDAERRYWPDGTFNIKAMIHATPSGALPYLLALVVCVTMGAAIPAGWVAGEWPKVGFWAPVFWMCGFWVFIWASARLCSSLGQGVRAARALHVVFLVLICVIPTTVLSFAQIWFQTPAIWDIYIFRPITTDNSLYIWSYSAALLICGVVIAYFAEKNAQRVLQRRGWIANEKRAKFEV